MTKLYFKAHIYNILSWNISHPDCPCYKILEELLRAHTKCKGLLFFISNTHTHMHKPTDMLTVPAAMGMENAEVQGHLKYSAAWGSLLLQHHILYSHTCTQIHIAAYILHIHVSLTLASEPVKCLSGVNLARWKSPHIHKQSQMWFFNRDTITCVCFGTTDNLDKKNERYSYWTIAIFCHQLAILLP